MVFGLKYIQIICLLILSCGHGTCYRSFNGRIEGDDSDYTKYKILLKRWYSEIMAPETLNLNGDGEFGSEKIGMHAQEDCKKDCPNGDYTMPDSIGIAILQKNDNSILNEKIFHCEDYIFNGDDIQLPTIVLP